MCELKIKQQCNDCPWRRNAFPGWLGNSTVENFLATTLGESHMPCHQTIDYEDDEWKDTQLPDAPFCAGSLIFFQNYFKMPRDEKLCDAVKAVKRNPEEIFTQPAEFLAYHGGTAFMMQWTSPLWGALTYDLDAKQFVLDIYASEPYLMDDELPCDSKTFTKAEEWLSEGWRFDALATIGVMA